MIIFGDLSDIPPLFFFESASSNCIKNPGGNFGRFPEGISEWIPAGFSDEIPVRTPADNSQHS